MTLHAQAYHVVVGNPPYINVKDPELRRLYRLYYKSCSGKYQISVPFTELLFNLGESYGYVGMITSNAFMKRGFGKKLIEEYLPKWDISQVIDTSGVYLPGHGTPTTILFRTEPRLPVAHKLRVVRGIRGEFVAPSVLLKRPFGAEIRTTSILPGFRWPLY